MEIDRSNKQRLNPFALPAETSARFTLLIATALTLVWTVGTFFINTVIAKMFSLPSEDEVEWVWGIVTALQGGGSKNPDQVAIEASLAQLWAVLAENLLLLTLLLSFSVLLFFITIMIYLSHPVRIRRYKKLRVKLPAQDPDLFEEVNRLASLAGISPSPTLEIQEKSLSIEGQAFGFRKQYSLGLGGRIPLQLRKAPDLFRATILHELAHVVNQDVWRYYFSEAIWYAVIFLALVPWLIYIYFNLIRAVVQGLLTAGLAGVNWIFLLTDVLPTDLFLTLQLGLTLLIIWLIRNSLLRTREFYADWRTALWGVEQPLSTRLQTSASGEKSRGRYWARLKRLHPTAQERLDTLQDPSNLFRIKLDLPFLGGFLFGYILSGLLRFIIFLWIPVRLGSEIVFLHLVQLTINWPPLLSSPTIALARLGMRHLIPDAALLGLLLVIAYLVTGTVGLQVQRESIAELLTGQQGYTRYLRLLLPAALMAIGFEIGILLAPLNFFAPRGLLPILLIPLGLIGLTFLTWMWLVYVRFFAQRLFGSHIQISAPHWTRRFLTLVMSGLLWILYLPAIISHLTITIISSPDELGFSIKISLITLGIALFLYVLVFGITWGLVQIKRLFIRLRCPSCQQDIDYQFTLDQRCKQCGHNLALWLFAEPLSTKADL